MFLKLNFLESVEKILFFFLRDVLLKFDSYFTQKKYIEHESVNSISKCFFQ